MYGKRRTISLWEIWPPGHLRLGVRVNVGSYPFLCNRLYLNLFYQIDKTSLIDYYISVNLKNTNYCLKKDIKSFLDSEKMESDIFVKETGVSINTIKEILNNNKTAIKLRYT